MPLGAVSSHHLSVAWLPVIKTLQQGNQLVLNSHKDFCRNIAVFNAAGLKLLKALERCVDETRGRHFVDVGGVVAGHRFTWCG